MQVAELYGYADGIGVLNHSGYAEGPEVLNHSGYAEECAGAMGLQMLTSPRCDFLWLI